MRLTYAALAVAASFVSLPAMAVTGQSIGGGNCSGDLTITGASSLISCYGRFDGNLLNNMSGSNTDANFALDQLGYGGADIKYNQISTDWKVSAGSDAGSVVSFTNTLNGTSYIGIHFGNGGPAGIGNTTSFYKINAVNLTSFTLNPAGGSGATVFVTTTAAVPEPGTWALMILGFGVVGYAMRRRQIAYRAPQLV
jgi:hypothetical protein